MTPAEVSENAVFGEIAKSPSAFFPPPAAADDSGLLMLGGRLTVDWLLDAYARGIFPWPIVTERGAVLAWFSPDPRAILELDQLYVSRRLRRRLRTGRYHLTQNTAFPQVVAGCAEPRADGDGTWITQEIGEAYVALHQRGFAHSIEVWQEQALVGGLYGVALGGFFSGESMFHRQRDASKIALVYLVEHLRERGFVLLDVQQSTPHMSRMGAVQIPRWKYLQRLEAALALQTRFA